MVFTTDQQHEAEFIYFLPFAAMDENEMTAFITRLALEARGTELAVVHSKWTHDSRQRYRLITASGQTLVGSYRARAQTTGDCFLIHPLNPKSLTTRCRIPENRVMDIIESFVDNTPLDFAIHADFDKKRGQHLILSAGGERFLKRGDYPPKALYAVEEAPWGLSPFALSLTEWPLCERVAILERHFESVPESFGIVLDMLEGREGQPLARIVHTATSSIFLKPIDTEVLPGTLAHCRRIEDRQGRERIVTTILNRFRVIDACQYCFGYGIRVCPECNGERFVTCPQCLGTGDIPCGRCGGTQVCQVCDGPGYYLDSGRACKRCDGSNVCQSCLKTPGRWSCRECRGRKTVLCGYCGGERVSECECGGPRRGSIIEVASS